MNARHSWRASVDHLHRDLARVFGSGLRSLAAYDPHGAGLLSPDEGGQAGAGQGGHAAEGGETSHAALVHTIATVEAIGYDHLQELAGLAHSWARLGLATPLLVTAEELGRSLDAFPLEYAAIIAHHVVVAGDDPFAGLAVRPDDLRRACEVQARSHLLHVREGLVETGGRMSAVAALLAASAPGFRALAANLARLDGQPADSADDLVRYLSTRAGLQAAVAREVIGLSSPDELSAAAVKRLAPDLLGAVERLVRFVDEWAR